MFRIAICDDEAAVRSRLHDFLRQYEAAEGQSFEVLCFDSAEALLKDYPAELDLLFLDIAMAGVDGMAAARQLRTFDQSVCIIFITTLYQRAIDGYAVRAFGFIKKPVSQAELRHELTCALTQIESQRARDSFITLRDAGGLHRLPVSHISYCEIRNHNARLCMGGAVSEYRCSMAKLEELLGPQGFFRCHASFLVNGSMIQKIEPTQVLLTDGSAVPVSQRRRREFMNAISRYLGERI